MKVTMWKLERITPYARNPRQNESAVSVVAASIAEFGFRQPIVVDENGIIIVGHTRFLAAERLGLTRVPVHVAEGLSENQVKAYRIADNKTGEAADWMPDLLALELKDLTEGGYNPELTGFTAAEIAELTEAPNFDGALGGGENAEGYTEAPDAEQSDQASVGMSLGRFRFTIERAGYEAWLEEIYQRVGMNEDEVTTELKRRLGL